MRFLLRLPAWLSWHKHDPGPVNVCHACRERADIVNAHNRRKKDLNDMNAAMEHEFSEAENELKQEFETQVGGM